MGRDEFAIWRDVACATKQGFENFDIAKQAAKRTRRARHCRAHPYKCRYCGLWHIGGGVKRAAKAIG